jgi:hypothetical protein
MLEDGDFTDLDTVPSIAMSQWQAGRVLSDADVVMIGKLLKELDDEMASGVDAFSQGREQVLHELGGQEFVDLDNKCMEIDAKLAWKRAVLWRKRHKKPQEFQPHERRE